MDEFYKIILKQEALLKYDITEGFLILTEDGLLIHSTPEMLGIDEDIFVGLENIFE